MTPAAVASSGGEAAEIGRVPYMESVESCAQDRGGPPGRRRSQASPAPSGGGDPQVGCTVRLQVGNLPAPSEQGRLVQYRDPLSRACPAPSMMSTNASCALPGSTLTPAIAKPGKRDGRRSSGRSGVSRTERAVPPICMFTAIGAFARTASRAGVLCTSVPFLVLDCLLPGIGGCRSMVIVRLVWWYVGFWRG